MLAKKVGCYDDDLRVASFLHDIGKMGIAKEILLKPGKLSTIKKSLKAIATLEIQSFVKN
ncbi:hypothetical protein [Ornithinibacillus halotolerans]|uniref:HD-GYP domain-containing protein n=1 Tax=Ornithinibacillus halotolerans TaxID=1274357 RepID=A0A916WE93_9BACI|nr:hypothetical protein [Ornithinibacillus halotolerans]GGA90141.1 hypothetical protein GCM10008025_35920 [Ornithinibacillus halotolerans]